MADLAELTAGPGVVEQPLFSSSDATALDNEKDSSGSGSDEGDPEPPPPPKPAQAPTTRKYVHEDATNPNWYKHKKHIFVFSSSGRPIYARYGDEAQLNTEIAFLTTIMSTCIHSFDDNIRAVIAGNRKFVFLAKGHIYLVAISSTSESATQLEHQLSYIYSQILTILHAGIISKISSRARFDLRTWLGDADEKLLDSLAKMMDKDFSFFMNAITCLRLPAAARNATAQLIQSAHTPDLQYAMLLARNQVITFVKPRKSTLQPADIHLVHNFLQSSTSLRASESWTPICLPNVNDRAFMYAYIHYVTPDVCLLLFSNNASAFFEMSNTKTKIVEGMQAQGIFDAIDNSIKQRYFSVTETKVPGLLHFIYKSHSTSQLTAPVIGPPYIDKFHKQRLFRLYQDIHESVNLGGQPHKVYYRVSQYETVVGWITTSFELYAAFGPLESKSSALKSCNQLLRWIKLEENDLFMLSAPMF